MIEDKRECEVICPLTKAPIGRDVRLCQLCGGRRMARRLAELGLTPGVNLRVVQDAGGPLLVSVRNSRVALGRGIADKLQVQVLPTDAMEKQGSPMREAEPVAATRGRGWRHGWRHNGRGHWGKR